MTWTHSNLSTQGYRLSESDTRILRVGLRFPTALATFCLDGRREREAIA